MEGNILILIFNLLMIALGAVIALFVKSWVDRSRLANLKQKSEDLLESARKEGESIKREKILEARDEAIARKQEQDREHEKRTEELRRQERKLDDRESSLDKRFDRVRQLEREQKDRERALRKQEEEVRKRDEELEALIEEHRKSLERTAAMTREEALEALKASVVDKARAETAERVKEMRDQAKLDANREAKELIIQAIHRSAADHTADHTVSVVNLPNDDIKGRIIGREGRNIRALEQETGVDIIVDDTPEAVILSSFDPFRREIARMALERLISDGRIHPARIEEVVGKAKQEMDERIAELGKNALVEAKVHGVHPELIKLLGRMNYRTSYGQNQLSHAIEVAKLSGVLATELGLDAKLARRAALLHDIGKSIDREMEGTHVAIGMDLARKYGEPKVVINAIGSHHGDVPVDNPISVLVAASDAISGSRPGARRETLDSYVQRLHRLEEISQGFEGVSKVYAIQAGREVRVIVESEKVSDALAEALAGDIAEKIEHELEYPGQIKVTVIREVRSVQYAK